MTYPGPANIAPWYLYNINRALALDKTSGNVSITGNVTVNPITGTVAITSNATPLTYSINWLGTNSLIIKEKMKKLLLVLLLLTPLTIFAQINKQCPQFTVNGTPQYQAQPGDQELCKTNYAVIHRCSVKAPIAVFEHLTLAGINGPAKRKDNFRPDPAVVLQCQSQLADYATAGNIYDRGHMSPAGNNTVNDQVMSESFFLSNMVPQVANNNRGIWKQLETWERNWALKGGDFYIISGGIYNPGHKVIGNGVGVPDSLFKIIIEKNSKKVMAYMMPNASLPVQDLPKYQVPIAAIEQATGMRFNLGQ
jgi:endonuclease G